MSQWSQPTDSVRYIDLFCGIGGFRYAIDGASSELGLKAECVFSSDIDPACCETYQANFGERPHGDITKIHAASIPDHDVLLAGFPCQAFSICGNGQGFEDQTKGTLFFDVARILDAKRPRVAVLENVKGLVGHDKGRTIRIIRDTLEEIGYRVDYRILNALDFGLPQKRERVFIVAFYRTWPSKFEWPQGGVPMKPLSEILEPDNEVPEEFWASEYIRTKRRLMHRPAVTPSIWHENKAGHISSYPYSCALRANASYNYILVNGERRLTPREMLRLQGFPESFLITSSVSETRKQAGNALPVPVAQAVIRKALEHVYLHSGREAANGERAASATAEA